jgi:energy-coupling factor transporter ATP-binding protein EcfA2
MPDNVIKVENVTRTYHGGDVDVRRCAASVSQWSAANSLPSWDRPARANRPSWPYWAASTGRPAPLFLRRYRRCRAAGAGARPDSQRASRLRIPELQPAGAHQRERERGAVVILFRHGSCQWKHPPGARAALRLLGLGDRERNSPGQLSGGQQQRVAIARALINSPSVLLADEPTRNLDTRTSHETMETLQSLNRVQGVTIVVVTHEPDIAAYANRTVTMRDGQTISDQRTGSIASPIRPAATKHAATDMSLFHPKAISDLAATPTAAYWAFFSMIAAAAAQAIYRNKMRSALTMLGVFIGVAYCHGGRRSGRERRDAQANRKPRHQPARGAARRHHDRRRARRLRQRLQRSRLPTRRRSGAKRRRWAA